MPMECRLNDLFQWTLTGKKRGKHEDFSKSQPKL